MQSASSESSSEIVEGHDEDAPHPPSQASSVARSNSSLAALVLAAMISLPVTILLIATTSMGLIWALPVYAGFGILIAILIMAFRHF